MTIAIELSNCSLIAGSQLSVRVRHAFAEKYRQIQIEIFDVGVLNPSPKLGLGTTPVIVDSNVVAVDIDSSTLQLGVYEIRLVRLHDPMESSLPQQLDYMPIRDFSRQLFEVGAAGGQPKSLSDLCAAIEKRESMLERSFLSPVDIREGGDQSIFESYCTFVFVRDVLIGTPIRFEHFELLPTNSGLDSKDSLDFVNAFLNRSTSTGIAFTYDERLAAQSRQSNPVCIVHYPNIVSGSEEAVRQYCTDRTSRLLLALALSRDAGGVIIEVVVIGLKSGRSTKFSTTPSYVGNYLTGHLSGESATGISSYLIGLENEMNRFLVGLYRDARRERGRDFQYVRFWQILETMAENKNFDPTEPLLDFDGNFMMDGTKRRQSVGSVNIVFRLLREAGIGSTDETWKRVNVWFAFRNAVAHHGAVDRYTELSRAGVRAWAEIAIAELAATSGHDRFLWELKEDTKLLLMQRLATGASSAA
jgi:hypothetical protein